MTVETVPRPDPLPASAGQDLLHLLGQRFSTGPEVPRGARTDHGGLDARGPGRGAGADHGALRPFRFVIVGDDQRPALSELFAQVPWNVASRPTTSRGPGHGPSTAPVARWPPGCP